MRDSMITKLSVILGSALIGHISEINEYLRFFSLLTAVIVGGFAVWDKIKKFFK